MTPRQRMRQRGVTDVAAGVAAGAARWLRSGRGGRVRLGTLGRRLVPFVERAADRVAAGHGVAGPGGVVAGRPVLSGASASVVDAWARSGDPATVPVTEGPRRGGRVRTVDVAWLADQLATTQAAGVPLFRALGMLARQRAGTPLGRRLDELQRRVGEGSTLSAALRSDEEIWGPLVCSLVAAGEVSGSLDTSFARIATLLEGRLALRRKILGALTYPAVVLGVTITLVAVLLVVVVPRFEDIYASLGSQLPALTRTVVALSAWAPLVGAAVAAVFAGVVVMLRMAKRRDGLGMRVDRVKLRFPVIGNLLARGVHARVAATLSSLLSSGVTLLEALGHAADASGSAPHRRSLQQMRARLADGETFSAVLEADGLWPDLMVQLVAVGEEAGSLPSMMDRYADRTAVEVDAAAQNLTKLIEPLLMVVIGAVVGVFLLALYLPIFDLGQQIR